MSTVMKLSDSQLNQVELALARRPKNQELLPLSEVSQLAALVDRDEVKGWEAVFKRAITDSGLFESEIADALEMDKGQLSKTLTAGNLQARRIEQFNEAVGNKIVLQVWNYRSGFELKPMLSTLERELEREREEKEEMAAKLAYFEEIIQKIK